MNKFSQTIQASIERKADQKYEDFFKQFEKLLNQHRLPRDVIFNGLRGTYQKDDDKNAQEWSNRVRDIFIQEETHNFISELVRLENYFKAGIPY